MRVGKYGTMVLVTGVLLVVLGSCASIANRPPISDYVRGWVEHDGELVASLFRDNGVYFDPENRTGLRRNSLADWVGEFENAVIEATGVREDESGIIVLSWSFSWPDERGTIHVEDRIRIVDGQIAVVENLGEPASDEHQELIAKYLGHRLAHEYQEAAAFFGETGRLYGSTIPSRGLVGSEIADFFENFADMTFQKREESVPRYTKDGRVFFEWVMLQANGSRLAAGKDFISITDGHFEEMLGVY